MIYLDTSALTRLVVRQPESASLLGYLSEEPERVSSSLARVELLRALARLESGGPLLRRAAAVLEYGPLLRRATSVLECIALVAIDRPVLERVATIGPPSLGTLDAIHLATAYSLVGDLDAVVTYDPRFAEAARGLGLEVVSPGARLGSTPGSAGTG